MPLCYIMGADGAMKETQLKVGEGGRLSMRDGTTLHHFARFDDIDAYAPVPEGTFPLPTLLDVHLPYPLSTRLYPCPVVWHITSPTRSIDSFWTCGVPGPPCGNATAAAGTKKKGPKEEKEEEDKEDEEDEEEEGDEGEDCVEDEDEDEDAEEEEDEEEDEEEEEEDCGDEDRDDALPVDDLATPDCCDDTQDLEMDDFIDHPLPPSSLSSKQKRRSSGS